MAATGAFLLGVGCGGEEVGLEDNGDVVPPEGTVQIEDGVEEDFCDMPYVLEAAATAEAFSLRYDTSCAPPNDPVWLNSPHEIKCRDLGFAIEAMESVRDIAEIICPLDVQVAAEDAAEVGPPTCGEVIDAFMGFALESQASNIPYSCAESSSARADCLRSQSSSENIVGSMLDVATKCSQDVHARAVRAGTQFVDMKLPCDLDEAEGALGLAESFRESWDTLGCPDIGEGHYEGTCASLETQMTGIRRDTLMCVVGCDDETWDSFEGRLDEVLAISDGEQDNMPCTRLDILQAGETIGIIKATRAELHEAGCGLRPGDMECNIYRNAADGLEDSVLLRTQDCPEDIQVAIRATLLE